MPFSIYDKQTNSKIGSGFKDKESAYERLVKMGVKPDQIGAFRVVEESTGKTTYSQRSDYYKDKPLIDRIYSEIAPSSSEMAMQGNDGIWESAMAAASDAFSLPGRAVAGLANKISGDGEGFNLGRRGIDEGTNIAGQIARDPMNLPYINGAGLMAKGIQKGSRLGKYILGKIGPKAEQVGKYVGGGIAGAGEGALAEAASSELDRREGNYIPAVALGAAFDIPGIFVRDRSIENGKNLVRSVADAMQYQKEGNRVIPDAERVTNVLGRPENDNTVKKLLDQQTSGRNFFPRLSKDRHSTLEQPITEAENSLADGLRFEDAFKDVPKPRFERYSPSTIDKFNLTPDLFVKNGSEIAVRKGYANALDKFRKRMNDIAAYSIGEYRKNQKGKLYFVGEKNSPSYYFNYLTQPEQTLGNFKRFNGRLTPENIQGLYTMASERNDERVKSAIIDFLKDLKVSPAAIEDFKKKGASLAQLTKAKEAIKNQSENMTVKDAAGTFIFPKRGFNFANSLGYNTQNGNINLRTLGTTDNPSPTGKVLRSLYYIGSSPAKKNSRY